MTAYAALLRAVNVGGTGVLPMSELRELCEELGFHGARTYIQSGNVMLTSRLSEKRVKHVLEDALAEKMGKPVAVLVRSAAELELVVERNPFADVAERVTVFFFDEKIAQSDVKRIVIPGREALRAVGRELYAHYPDGMGQSRLRIPFVSKGTGRSVKTVVKLIEMLNA